WTISRRAPTLAGKTASSIRSSTTARFFAIRSRCRQASCIRTATSSSRICCLRRYAETMATGTLVSVEEYLSTSYRPDCDYIDGVILERNVGESDHRREERRVAGCFISREEQWAVLVLTEICVEIAGN